MRKSNFFFLLICIFTFCLLQNSYSQGVGKILLGTNIGGTKLTSGGDLDFYLHVDGEGLYGLTPNFAAGASIGYSSTSITTLTEYTVNGRYYFSPYEKIKFFAEAGLGSYSAKVELATIIVVSSSSYLGMNIGAGASTSVGSGNKYVLTGKIKYHNPFTKSDEGKLNWINITLGVGIVL